MSHLPISNGKGIAPVLHQVNAPVELKRTTEEQVTNAVLCDFTPNNSLVRALINGRLEPVLVKPLLDSLCDPDIIQGYHPYLPGKSAAPIFAQIFLAASQDESLLSTLAQYGQDTLKEKFNTLDLSTILKRTDLELGKVHSVQWLAALALIGGNNLRTKRAAMLLEQRFPKWPYGKDKWLRNMPSAREIALRLDPNVVEKAQKSWAADMARHVVKLLDYGPKGVQQLYSELDDPRTTLRNCLVYVDVIDRIANGRVPPDSGWDVTEKAAKRARTVLAHLVGSVDRNARHAAILNEYGQTRLDWVAGTMLNKDGTMRAKNLATFRDRLTSISETAIHFGLRAWKAAGDEKRAAFVEKMLNKANRADMQGDRSQLVTLLRERWKPGNKKANTPLVNTGRKSVDPAEPQGGGQNKELQPQEVVNKQTERSQNEPPKQRKAASQAPKIDQAPQRREAPEVAKTEIVQSAPLKTTSELPHSQPKSTGELSYGHSKTTNERPQPGELSYNHSKTTNERPQPGEPNPVESYSAKVPGSDSGQPITSESEKVIVQTPVKTETGKKRPLLGKIFGRRRKSTGDLRGLAVPEAGVAKGNVWRLVTAWFSRWRS